MADPLSIATGCVAFIETITSVTSRINKFVRTVREARRDLDAVSRELSSIQNILDLISADASGPLADPLTQHLPGLVENCKRTIVDLERLLYKYHDGRRTTVAKWALSGKEEVEGLRARLETSTQSLNLALDTMNLVAAIEIKKNTADIKDNTTDIKENVATILEEILRLRARLPPDSLGTDDDAMLERWFEGLKSYTECAFDSPLVDTDETIPGDLGRPGEAGEPSSSADEEPGLSFVKLNKLMLDKASSSDGSSSTRDSFRELESETNQGSSKVSTTEIKPSSPGRRLQSKNSRKEPSQECEILPVAPQLVSDTPVPSRVLSQIEHKREPCFTHARHTAVTCHPKHFAPKNYTFRQTPCSPTTPTDLLLSVNLGVYKEFEILHILFGLGSHICPRPPFYEMSMSIPRSYV